MRILLTGAAGFIGHHVAQRLDGTGHEVVALIRCGKVGSLCRLQEVDFKGRIIWHDLRSPIPKTTADQLGDFDAVLHMGAETHVDRSILDPADFAMSNVVGTTNLLWWAKDHCERFVQFSTDEVFGPAEDSSTCAFSEEAPHNPRNPYAASKSGAEQMVKAFANTYRMRTAIVRGMNVFGERQHPEKWLPTVVRKLLTGEEITVHADPTRTRPGSRFYIYAGNVAKALEFILAVDESGPFHLVGEREVDNLEMVNLVAGILGVKGYRARLVDFHSSRPGHDLRYAMQDINLKALGWEIPQTFESSLRQTVSWYLEHREWL